MYDPKNAMIDTMYQTAPKKTILLFIYMGCPITQVENIIIILLNIMGTSAYLKVKESFSCISTIKLIPTPKK